MDTSLKIIVVESNINQEYIFKPSDKAGDEFLFGEINNIIEPILLELSCP